MNMRRLMNLVSEVSEVAETDLDQPMKRGSVLTLLENGPAVVNSEAFMRWFGGSKVVDAAGNPLSVYHGTARPDRVGTQFRKSRATSGPMAYFTDSPTVASNYSTSKADTSLENEDPSHGSWFKIKVPGMRNGVTLDRAWHFLDGAQKSRILSLAPRVMKDDQGENILLGPPDHKSGIGGYEYTFKEMRGDPLKTLMDRWLEGGALYGEEENFLDVLKLAGLTSPVQYDPPNAAYPFVYSVYLAIKRPLISTAIEQRVITALEQAVKGKRAPANAFGRDQWDKRIADPRQWLSSLLDDLKNNGGRLSWTVIPDWVTETLIKLGFDGIMDTGGKNGGEGHTVWIPFHEYQVKSAISNKGYNPDKKGIHEGG